MGTHVSREETIVSTSKGMQCIRCHVLILVRLFVLSTTSMFSKCGVIIGCNEVFRTARQLIRHKHNDHSNDLATRLTAEPSIVRRFPPSSIPPTMFKALPAYIIEYSSIQPASITRQRHEILMPSVSRIFHQFL